MGSANFCHKQVQACQPGRRKLTQSWFEHPSPYPERKDFVMIFKYGHSMERRLKREHEVNGG